MDVPVAVRPRCMFSTTCWPLPCMRASDSCAAGAASSVAPHAHTANPTQRGRWATARAAPPSRRMPPKQQSMAARLHLKRAPLVPPLAPSTAITGAKNRGAPVRRCARGRRSAPVIACALPPRRTIPAARTAAIRGAHGNGGGGRAPASAAPRARAARRAVHGERNSAAQPRERDSGADWAPMGAHRSSSRCRSSSGWLLSELSEPKMSDLVGHGRAP